MSTQPQPPGPDAAVPGLTRSDPHGPGISRQRDGSRFRYDDPSGAPVTDAETLLRIKALAIPPAWTNVWISPDPLGHIQATGVDSRGRTQYRYHQLWREQRDAQKFDHMLLFAGALPELRSATVHDLRRRNLEPGPRRRRGGPADRSGAVPDRRREVRRAGPPLRRDHAGEAARDRHPRRHQVRLHRQGGQAPGDHGQRPGGGADRARAGPQRQRPGPAVCLGARRHLAPAALARRERVHRGAGRRRTTRPRSSAPGTPPC